MVYNIALHLKESWVQNTEVTIGATNMMTLLVE